MVSLKNIEWEVVYMCELFYILDNPRQHQIKYFFKLSSCKCIFGSFLQNHTKNVLAADAEFDQFLVVNTKLFKIFNF